MGALTYDRVKITGLSAGWNTVTLSSFITLPPGHNTLWVEFDTNSTGTTYGIRKTGSGLTTTFPSNGRVINSQPVEITGGQIDVNLGSTVNGEVFICWSDDYHTWLPAPVNVIAGQTGVGTFVVDCTAALSAIVPTPPPSDCVGLFIVSRAVKFGPTGRTSMQQSHSLIGGLGYGAPQPCPLTAYKAEYTSGGGTTSATDIRLVAYAKKNCFVYPTDYLPIINPGPTAQWIEQPRNYLDTLINNFRWYNGGTGAVASCRAVGQVGYPLPNYTTPPLSAPDRNNGVTTHEWRPSGSNYRIEMFNNTDLTNYLVWMGGYVATIADAVITSIDQLVPGLVSTITLDQTFGSAATIHDGSFIKTVPLSSIGGNQYTFTMPSWVVDTPGLKYGTATVNVNDGTNATALFKKALTTEAGLAAVDGEAVGVYNYIAAAGATPLPKIFTQVRYAVAEGSVDKNLEYNNFNGTANFSGTTRIWDRDPDAPFWTRYLDVEVSEITPPVSGGGLTTRGLTVSGLTVRGLTTRGI